MDNTLGSPPKVRLGDWIGEGWNMFSAQWKVWLLNSLILFAAAAAPPFVIFILLMVIAPASAAGGGVGLSLVAFALIFFVFAFSVVAHVYLASGMYHCAFMQLRGEPISTGDLFAAGDKVPKVFVAALLVGIFAAIGSMLCIIPGLMVMGALFFTIPLIIEREI